MASASTVLVTLTVLWGCVSSADVPNYPDNLGQEFNLMFLENALSRSTTPSLPLVLFIANPNDAAASVTVEAPNVKKTLTVAGGAVERLELPKELRVVGTTIAQKAVIVKANKQIGVYGSNQEEFSTGAFLGLPIDVMDTKYYAVCWNTPKKKCQVGVVASADNTKVDVTIGPNGKVEYQSKVYGAGEKLSVTLAKYDCLQLQSKETEDLTGTYISTSSKVSAFSGNIKTGIKRDSPIDHVVEQLIPLSRWGTDFITVPIAERTTGDSFTFVASEDDTIIKINGITKTPKEIKIAKAGGSVTELLSSQTYTLVHSNKPIMLAQFVLSQFAKVFGTQTDSKEEADPAMLLIPPIQQFNADYTFSTLELKRSGVDSDYKNYLMLAVKDEDKEGILLDGKVLVKTKTVTWRKVPDTDYVSTDFQVSSGVHKVSHQNPTKTYAGYLYGFFRAEAYAFPTGMRLAQINPCVKTATTLEGDGLDNDCDGRVDEEFCYEDGIKADDDGDGRIDEDCVKMPADYLRPVAFTANSATSEAVQVDFKPPTKGPRPHGYEIYFYLTSAGYKTKRYLKTLYIQATAYKFTLNNLQPETEYTLIVSTRLNGSQARADNAITVKTKPGRPVEVQPPKLTVAANAEKTKLIFTLSTVALTQASLQYVVEWYNNQERIKVVTMAAGMTSVSLQQSELTIRGYGVSVYAIIYSCRVSSCANSKSTPKRSNVWVAKIEVSTKSLTVVEGGAEGEIKFSSTAPPSLLCNDTTAACTSIRVQAYQINAARELTFRGRTVIQAVVVSRETDVSKAFCGVEITEKTWYKEMVIHVKAKVDRLVDGKQDRQFAVEWSQRVTVANSVIVSKIVAEKVKVTIMDKGKQASCHSLCDPHIKTFDSVNYNNHLSGEFVLYKHKTRPFAVHTIYKKCSKGSSVTCNCGVFIKSGDDVIVIDRCGSKRGPMELLLYKNGELTPGTQIYNYGSKYVVYLPTGAVVTVKPLSGHRSKHINVYVQPSVLDMSSAEGLCGDYDGKRDNEFMMPDGKIAPESRGRLRLKFSKLWRVDKEESIRYGVCASTKDAERKFVYCDCTGDPAKDRCDLGIEAVPYGGNGKNGRDITDELVRGGLAPKPYFKCGSTNVVEQTFQTTFYDIRELTEIIFSSKQWSETKAREYCVAFMKKLAVINSCQKVIAAQEYQAIITNCVEDIVASDSTEWALTAREALKQICVFEVEANTKLWVEVNGVLGLPGNIVDAICENDCSGQGTCKKGVCECKKGFIGDDCSIEAGKPPAIDFVDISPCDPQKPNVGPQATMFGAGFARTSTLMCYSQTVTMSVQKKEIIGPVVRTSAVFISRNQVVCKMKTCSSFQIAVGNVDAVVSDKVQAVTDDKLLKKAMLKTAVVNKKMTFECSFDVDGDATTQYKIFWYNNVEKIKTVTVDGNGVGKVSITEDELTVLGYETTVHCRVQACKKASCDSSKGVMVKSNLYVARIKLASKEITLVEGGDEKMIEFKLDASPRILCPRKDGRCYYKIVAVQELAKREFRCPNRYPISQAVIGYKGTEIKDAFCGVTVDVDDWTKPQQIPVKAKADGRNDGVQSRQFTFYLYTAIEVAGVRLEKEERVVISSIKVKIEDKDKRATCKCTNDPHITTFDGIFYNNHMEGEFALYKHTALQQAVHMFFKTCQGLRAGNNAASCNCAAAVRSGDDVILFDSCTNKRRKKGWLSVKMYKNGELTPGTRIFSLNGGNKFKIQLPSGTVVNIKPHRGRSYLNIFITAGAADYGQVQGLCGDFDGDKTKEFTLPSGRVLQPTRKRRFVTDFSKLWRIGIKDSIYRGVCAEERVEKKKVYCDCANGVPKLCDYGLDNIPCGVEHFAQEKTKKRRKTKDITLFLVNQARKPDPPKMCKEDKELKEKYLLEFNEKIVEEETDIVVTNKEWTVEKSLKFCRDYIMKKKVGQSCGAVISKAAMDIDLAGCSQDVAMTEGEVAWAMTAFESVKEQCETELERDVKYLVEVGGELVINATIAGAICPNECSGNGECKNGECECKNGFISPDCSVDKTKPPDVNDCARGCVQGQCFASIIGDNFVEGEKFSCHVQEVEFAAGKIIKKGDVTIRKAVFVSRFEAQCEVREETNYVIKISNEDTRITSRALYCLDVDRRCWDCDIFSGVCVQKESTCYIDNKCHMKDAVNPDNEGEICDPGKSKTSWSIKIACVTLEYTKIVSGFLDGTKIKVEGGAAIIGEEKSNVLELNGRKQYLEFDALGGSCLSDLNKCKKGFTIVLPIKFTELKENMYIISSGGEKKNTQGVSVVYRYGRLWFHFTTETKAWYATLDEKLVVNKWYYFEVVFTVSDGVKIYSDNKLVKTVSVFQKRSSTLKISEKVYIGRASWDECTQEFAEVRLKRVLMCYATREKLIEVGIITGPTTPPPPTTTPLPPLPPKCKGRPVVPSAPALEVTFDDQAAEQATIKCSVPFVSASIQYGVNWYIAGKLVKFEWIPPSEKAVILDRTTYRLTSLRQQVFCTLTARYRLAECADTRSRAIKSNVYQAILKIEAKDTITLEEGGSEEEIDVIAAAPPSVLCGIGGASIEIDVVIQKSKRDFRCRKKYLPQFVIRPPTDSQADVCGAQLDVNNWRSQQTFAIKGYADFKLDKTQYREAWVYMKCMVAGRVRSTKKIKTIKVTVTDKDRNARCDCVGDPHMKTFDNWKYNVYLPGEFVLYQHSTKPYAVHGFFKKCGRAACNCGGAVRAGNDVIVIDWCQNRNPRVPRKKARLNVQLFKNGDATPALEVYKTKIGYEVHLPTGTYVVFKIRRAGRISAYVLDLYIHASPSDRKKTKGLCGVWDGNERNDLTVIGRKKPYSYKRFPNAFSKSWRVSGTKSIYKGTAGSFAASVNIKTRYCHCVGVGSKVERRCGVKLDKNDCDLSYGIKSGKLVTKRIKQTIVRVQGGTRGKRAVDDTAFQYDPNYVNPEVTWPTEKGVTLEQAREYCTEGFTNNTAIKKCTQTKPKDFSSSIEDCIADIGATDDMTWRQSALETEKEACQKEALTDTSLFKPDANGDLQPPEDILSAICPNECSQQGTCANGVCNCNPGFIGDDCSLTNTPPEVDEIEENGLCDIRQSTCTETTVYGSNFLDSETLTCHLQELEISTYKKVGDVKTVKGVFISVDQVVCQSLKPVSYNISISNTGSNPGSEQLRVVYDSVCHTCQDPSSCTGNDKGCVINGKCYKHGDEDPVQRCNVCNAKVQNTQWSKRIDANCGDKGPGVASENNAQTIIIIVTVFAVVLIVTVVATYCGVKKCSKNGKLPGHMSDSLSSSRKNLQGSLEPARAWRADYGETNNGASSGRI